MRGFNVEENVDQKVLIQVIDNGFNFDIMLDGKEIVIAGAMVSLLKMLDDCLKEKGRTEEEVEKMMSEIWDEYKKERNK
jgi:hypothetical protein